MTIEYYIEIRKRNDVVSNCLFDAFRYAYIDKREFKFNEVYNILKYDMHLDMRDYYYIKS